MTSKPKKLPYSLETKQVPPEQHGNFNDKLYHQTCLVLTQLRIAVSMFSEQECEALCFCLYNMENQNGIGFPHSRCKFSFGMFIAKIYVVCSLNKMN